LFEYRLSTAMLVMRAIDDIDQSSAAQRAGCFPISCARRGGARGPRTSERALRRIALHVTGKADDLCGFVDER